MTCWMSWTSLVRTMCPAGKTRPPGPLTARPMRRSPRSNAISFCCSASDFIETRGIQPELRQSLAHEGGNAVQSLVHLLGLFAAGLGHLGASAATAAHDLGGVPGDVAGM